jgi:hypothetical protein
MFDVNSDGLLLTLGRHGGTSLRQFGNRVYWVTLGRDVGRQAMAGLVNGLIAQVDPGPPGDVHRCPAGP